MTTKESKTWHALGKWTAHIKDEGRDVNRVYCGSQFVCETRQGEVGYADAVAIAALPDLLAAAKKALGVMEDEWGMDPYNSQGDLRAAIAKAQGGK